MAASVTDSPPIGGLKGKTPLPETIIPWEQFFRSPAAAAAAAARRGGVNLTAGIAEAIATAVLEFTDDEYRVQLGFAHGYRHHALSDARQRSLRARLAAEVMEAGFVPTSAPRRIVQDSGLPWEMGYVELVVPVRKVKPQ